MFRRSAIDEMENKLYEMLPPIHGTWFFVDPTDGSNSKNGRTRATAVADLPTAYGKCTTGRGDGICHISRGITTAGCSSYLTESLDWSKWGITVVGLSAPTMYAQRSRIVNNTSTQTLVYIIDIQGSNNAFYNLHFGNFGTNAAAVGGVKVTGNRNYFEKVSMVGGAGRAGADGDYDLSLCGAENTFFKCAIGTDTHDKGNKTNCNLLFHGSGDVIVMRNVWDSCIFLSKHSAGTTAGAIRCAGSASVHDFQLFKNCDFLAYRDGGAIPAEAALVIGTNPNNGGFVFDSQCAALGYDDWGAAAAFCYTAAATAHETGGQYLAANPS